MISNFEKEWRHLSQKAAIIDDYQEIVSYEELKNLRLFYSGIITGKNLVAILADNTTETACFYVSTIDSEQVVFLLNPKWNIDYILQYINLYRPQYVWTSLSINRLADVLDCVVVYRTNKHVLLRTNYSNSNMDDDLCVLLTTSGSTGNPKTVRLSRKNIVSNYRMFIKTVGLREDDKGFLSLPFYHAYGLTVLNSHLAKGATIVLTENRTHETQYEETIRRELITNLHGVPYLYKKIDETGVLFRLPSTVRFLTVSGGCMDEEIFRKTKQMSLDQSITFFILYGQTEGTALLAGYEVNASDEMVNCIGFPCCDVNASIDPDNSELCFEGDSVSMGYAMNYQDLGLGDSNGKFLRTGDIASIDSTGRIYLIGRLKRNIKIKGYSYNLDDIERNLGSHFNIDVACCGDDDLLKVYYKGTVTDCDIMNWIMECYQISKARVFIKAIAEVPRTVLGKIDYHSLTKIG